MMMYSVAWLILNRTSHRHPARHTASYENNKHFFIPSGARCVISLVSWSSSPAVAERSKRSRPCFRRRQYRKSSYGTFCLKLTKKKKKIWLNQYENILQKLYYICEFQWRMHISTPEHYRWTHVIYRRGMIYKK